MSVTLIAHGKAAGVDGCTVTGLNTVGADFIVAVAVRDLGSTGESFVDSEGLTWTPLFPSGLGRLYYAWNVTGASSHSFTLSFGSSSNFTSLAVAAFSGLKIAADPYLALNVALDNGLTVSCGITPTTHCLVIGGLGFNDTQTVSVDSGLTIIDTQQFGSGNNYGASLAWKEQGTPATITPEWTITQSRQLDASVAAFETLVAGGDDGGGDEDAPLTIDTPAAYQCHQMDGSQQADIAISGTYTADTPPTSIEASWNGGAFVTIDAAPSGGTYSGTLTGQSRGQGTLTVRFSDDTDITASVDYVSIGDIFLLVGQSNMNGPGDNLQEYQTVNYKAGLFGNDYTWKELVDPVDDPTGQVDAVSDDGAAAGSFVPLLATLYMARTRTPVAFVPAPLSGTTISQWLPGASHVDRNTLYGSAIYRALQVGGVKGALMWQGESDGIAATAGATYNSSLDTIANAIMADLGVKLMICKFQRCSGITDADEDAINDAIGDAWADNPNVLAGPDLTDITSDDSYHLKTDAKLAVAAARWDDAIRTAFAESSGGVNRATLAAGLSSLG